MLEVTRCEACRAFVRAEDSFCWSCGAPVGDTEIAVNSQTIAETVEVDPDVALTLRRAHLARQRGRAAEAERLVLDVLEQRPDSVPALSMLSEILRAKGDLVGAVAAAQRATDGAADGAAPPGSISTARQQRAQIEDHVVKEVSRPYDQPADTPLSLLLAPAVSWYRSRGCYLALGILGLISLQLAIVAAFRGHLTGYFWLGASLVAAGWVYSDAETRKLGGLFWGPLVLCLGPFGLAIYILATY
jgi:hypothetical protein